MQLMMNELFTRALGIEAPWRIIEVSFSELERELNIHLDYPRGSRFRCPQCGKDLDLGARDAGRRTGPTH